MKNITISLFCLVWVVLLSGCGTEKVVDGNGLCKRVEGSIYFTPSLETGGLSINGPSYMHWHVSFAGGKLTYRQTDTVEVVDYQCKNGVVTSDSAKKISFSGDFKEVSITRGGAALTYRLGQSSPNYAPCGEVAGRSYAVAESASSALVAVPKRPYSRVAFGQDQKVTLTTDSKQTIEGLYECTSDAMHIHTSVKDLNPILVVVNRHGIDISLTTGGSTYVLPEFKELVACPAIYAPVCSVRLKSMQCLVAPCPVGLYETSPSQCNSDADKLMFISKGECGDLEGKPYYETQACTREYKPVCAAVTSLEPCGIVPCPARIHKTFGNQCEADAAKAWTLSTGECGKLENAAVEGGLPGACPANYDPVCGKVKANIACITAPCPSHEYRNLGNQCSANFAQATTVFKGECLGLEGALAGGEPPIQITDSLPKESKKVTVTNPVIDGDILTVTLGYSGCQAQHFHLYAGTAFAESNPVQVRAVFQPLVDDACAAYFTTEFKYDLLPLKESWQRAYGKRSGKVSISNLGLYSF